LNITAWNGQCGNYGSFQHFRQKSKSGVPWFLCGFWGFFVGCVFSKLELTAAKGEERTEVNSGHVMKDQAWMQDGNLDNAVWGALPEELLEHNMAYLPFHDLTLATMCKHW
jgi:hypothetical protein